MGRRHALLALYTLSLLTTSFAWTFVWHNAQNNSFVESGSSDYPCTQVDNPEGMAFEYDSEEDPTTIYLYGNNNCAGTPGGQADHYLAKAAGNFIGSFRIVDRTKAASASTSATVTAIATATTADSTSATETGSTGTGSAQPTTSASGGASSLSGGAIAGVVVGVVAGVVLIAAVVFFLVRRRRKVAAAAAAASVGAGQSESGAPTLVQSPAVQGYQEPLGKAPVSVAQTHAPKATQVVELSGDSAMVEMSDSHRVNELEDSSQRGHL